MNKSSKETHNISYNKSFIIIKTNNTEKSITGGEAVNLLLTILNLKNIYDSKT